MTVAPVNDDRYECRLGQAASMRAAKSPRVICVVEAVPAAAVLAAGVGLTLAVVACG
jgi:hypothetical protein